MYGKLSARREDWEHPTAECRAREEDVRSDVLEQVERGRPDDEGCKEAEMKYRKKAIVVEAVRLGWDTWSEMCEFAGVGKLDEGKPSGCFLDEEGKPKPDDATEGTMGLLIPTLEGLMVGSEGDYIIRGVKGEFNPCKPDVFAATYEAVPQ